MTQSSPITRLLERPQRFGFHQAVRLLGQWLRGRHPEAGRPLLRYRNGLSLSFPASEIAQLTVHRRDAASEEVDRVEVTPSFMGLLGAGGALPLFYTELLAAREDAPHRDPAARAFLDIFQHRAVSQFHEAWRKNRLSLQYERDGDDHFLPMALSLAGIGQPALRSRLQARSGGVADHALAYYAGALQQRHVGARQLQRLLASYFGVAVAVKQFVGRWFVLERSDRTRLGKANGSLGGAAVVGERVWQRDLRMRITLGPLDQAELRRFLPGAPGALALRELLTLINGVSLAYEIRLCLRAEAIDTVRLGASSTCAARLGWNSFVQSRASPRDRSEAGYDIHAVRV